jgi:hypothetical protein
MLLALLTLVGCDALNKARDTIDGLLEPVVVQGIVLGLEPPQNQQLQELLDQSEFQSGTTATIFMADAKEVAEIENAPITGATVSLLGPGAGVTLGEIDAGVYGLAPGADPLEYASGETRELESVRGSGDSQQVSTAQVQLPPAQDFSAEIPEEHDVNTPIELDFTGLPYDSALVLVLDDEGNVTYSNEPTTIKEVYDFTQGSTELGVVTIPAEAFPDEGVFMVGVAGMVNTDPADLSEMNTGLSSVVSGLMKTYAVSTIPLDIPQQ